MGLPWEKLNVEVLVVGDVMLDEYLDGQVERISPEAPVPVHSVQDRWFSAGGAANVAQNIKLAGGKARLCSVVGDDQAAEHLTSILQANAIDTAGLLKTEYRKTTKKTRVYAHNQQVLRLDREEAAPLTKSEQELVCEIVHKAPFDVLLLSDYGKGILLPAEFVAKLISLAQAKHRRVVVDPKGEDFRKYAHADLITPNQTEARFALGLKDENYRGEQLGRKLQRKFQLRGNVLVTMGAQGMVYVPSDPHQPAITKQTRAREVFDVSGAGDTVAALMALSLASSISIPDALEIANHGAGIVVEKRGTQAVTAAELGKSLAHKRFSTADKIIDPRHIAATVEKVRVRGKKVVFTNGCFDILHAGHLNFLEEACSTGDLLVVGVNSDASVSHLKGPNRPIIPLQARMRLIAGLSCVDLVTHFDNLTPAKLIAQIEPDVLLKGADWKEADIAGADTVIKKGGTVATIPLLTGHSTSAIIAKITSPTPTQ